MTTTTNSRVLASSLAKRAPGYTSLGFPDPRAPLAEGHLISTAVTEQLSASEVKKWGPLVRSLERIVTHIVTTTPDFHRRSATASDTCKAPNCRNATSRDRLRRNCRAWRVERDGVD
jgi:hypothetical protein